MHFSIFVEHPIEEIVYIRDIRVIEVDHSNRGKETINISVYMEKKKKTVWSKIWMTLKYPIENGMQWTEWRKCQCEADISYDCRDCVN